jgi:hypothetical protein
MSWRREEEFVRETACRLVSVPPDTRNPTQSNTLELLWTKELGLEPSTHVSLVFIIGGFQETQKVYKQL